MGKSWINEFELVKKVFPDSEVYLVNAEYEVFHAVVDGVRLIFYPHKTSSNNYHLRIRNGSPKRKEDFNCLAGILGNSKNPSCTFHVKNMHGIWHNNYEKCQLSKYNQYWENAKSLERITI